MGMAATARVASIVLAMVGAYGDNETKAYALEGIERLKNLVKRGKRTKAPLDLVELFYERVADVNELLESLNADDSRDQGETEEIIRQIAARMEVLRKLLNVMDNPAPVEELRKICADNNGLFHDTVCNRPVKKRLKKERDSRLDSRSGVPPGLRPPVLDEIDEPNPSAP